jgi:SAM-dependent methyltransferase
MATLNLGCGVNPIQGAINHDISLHDSWVDVAHDLEVTPWPWQDESFDKVIAVDVLEHLRPWKLEMCDWLAELWRILKPDGLAQLHLPAWDFEYSYRDPTHFKVFHKESFNYWEPGNHLYENYGRYYKGIAEYGRWWQIEFADYDFPERPQPYKGDLGFILRKLA